MERAHVIFVLLAGGLCLGMLLFYPEHVRYPQLALGVAIFSGIVAFLKWGWR